LGECLLALAVAFTAPRCKREAERAPPPRLEAVRSGLVSAGPVASAGAFDLVLAPSGPLLIWAPPRAAGGNGAIMARALDAFGEPRGAARALVAAGAERGEVIELAAAASGQQVEQVGVVFREASADAVRTLAVLAGGTGPAQPELLATSAGDAGKLERGRLAIAATSSGRMRLMYPAGPAECVDDEGEACVGFAFRELGQDGRSEADRPWLSVPAPCPEGATSVAGLAGRFFYAVCSWRGDAPSTMAYAINVETYYARADEVLRGCVPIGMVAVDADTVLLGGDCGVTRRAARLTLDMKPPAEFPLDALALACQRDAASITANGWALPLDGARAELEAILPETIAPSGARALWSGSALLVAQRMSGSLELRRYTCANGRLHAESSAAAAR
jgi:hypothetical protein